MLLAAGFVGAVGTWAIALLIVFGIVAVAYVIMGVLGVKPPDWVVKIFWIIVAVVVGVIVIGFLVSLAGGGPVFRVGYVDTLVLQNWRMN